MEQALPQTAESDAGISQSFEVPKASNGGEHEKTKDTPDAIQSAKVSFGTICVELGDAEVWGDLSEKFLRFNVDELSMMASRVVGSAKNEAYGNGSVAFAAYFKTPGAISWEPLLEKVALKCELRAPGNTSEIDPSVHGESSNELSISVAKDINVNVTQKTIAAAISFSYILRCVLEDGAKIVAFTIFEIYPLKMRVQIESAYLNESGYPLQITPTVSVDDESASDAFPTASGWLKTSTPRHKADRASLRRRVAPNISRNAAMEAGSHWV